VLAAHGVGHVPDLDDPHCVLEVIDVPVQRARGIEVATDARPEAAGTECAPDVYVEAPVEVDTAQLPYPDDRARGAFEDEGVSAGRVS